MGIKRVVIVDKQDSNRVILQDDTGIFLTGVEYKIPFAELVSSNDNYYQIGIRISITIDGSGYQEYVWREHSEGWYSNIFIYQDI